MKEATKSIIELAINNDDQVDPKIAKFITMALVGVMPQADERYKNHDEPLLLKMNEAAKKLGVSRVTFWRLVNTGAIKPIELFEGVFRYCYEDLLDLSQQHSQYKPKVRGKASSAEAHD